MSSTGVFRIIQSVLSGKTADQSRPEDKTQGTPPGPYHSVTIKSLRSSCVTARALKGIRFLSKEAPALPLEDCDVDICNCRYEHHADRRDRPRRGTEMGAAKIPSMSGEEKRHERDRRSTAEVIDEFDGSDTYFDYVCQRLVREHAEKAGTLKKLGLSEDELYSEDKVWYENEKPVEK
ncbi:MAG: hypothetical protein IIB68_04705 [Proteobacteria bacterium]|nr:hypothetical protein [Pseudomonadota bacterium]MCH7893439.1 hypothetical protein [Pseudomonadota bacterium]